MTVPKANKFYDTGLNTGSALSLTTNMGTATFSLASGSYSITGTQTVGSNYDDDTWMFKIADAAEATDAG